MLGWPLVGEGRLDTFDPGWRPPPLRFTAAYLGEPKSHLVEVAAKLAKECAERFRDIKKDYHARENQFI